MTIRSAQIGQWTAWTETIVGYTYLAGYIALLAVFSLKPWNNIQTFADEIDSPYFIALTGLQVLALFFLPYYWHWDRSGFS